MPREPISVQIGPSKMRMDLKESPYQKMDSLDGEQRYALSIAMVVAVDSAKMTVTLRTDGGEHFLKTPIPLTFPGAGSRHFLGSMPEVGDYCIIGFGQQESGRTRQPIILTWVVPGVVAGNDWWITQPFSPDEKGMSEKDQLLWKGITDRTRHKLRHMLPGNIMASSSQGADLVLSESALLANRRGNEILLRDQDQAIVFRSLQEFHAQAGTRIYSGLVQRDATFLPTTMFSDGLWWDAPLQVNEDGTVVTRSEMGISSIPNGVLQPSDVFLMDDEGNNAAGQAFGSNIDPYVFLQRGLFCDAYGNATGVHSSSGIAGGKTYYRVTTDSKNAATSTDASALTEYRIEVSHTADGTLPVTEQTDGFDADRLPGVPSRQTSPLNNSAAAPFVEFVLGSVVGNDPFSLQGRQTYGLPLRPVLFTDENRTPAIVSASDRPIPQHAAVLLKVTPPDEVSPSPAFFVMSKDGRAFLSLTGPQTDFSLETVLARGMRLGAGASAGGESIKIDTDGRISIRAIRGDSRTNRAVDILSDEGAIRIKAGGSETITGLSQRTAPSGKGEGASPGLTLESGTNTVIRAARVLTLAAPELEAKDVATMTFQAQSGIHLAAGDAVTQTSKTSDKTVLGRATETYGGPKDSLPSNAPLRDVSFVGNPATGLAGGTVDKYSVLYGDREESLKAGNHSTTILVGNQTYSCRVGTWKAEAGPNSLSVSPTGITGDVVTGTISFSAVAGTATISGTAGVTITSTGPTVVRGSVVTLAAPGGKSGGIVSGADLDPISGLPLQVLGLGSLNQVLLGT